MTAPDVDRLTRALIERPSVTPDDAGCQALLRNVLEPIGFRCRTLEFGAVTNLFATHGAGAPLVVLAGHTDVVPAGPVEAWSSDPFTATVRDGFLFGRGAADMKSSLAAMANAAHRFVTAHPDHAGTVALLITSDEEGPAVDGTRRVLDALADEGVICDFCIVGEPSSSEVLGDVIRNGRRGSLNGALTVEGVQGHVAYPDDATNPVHAALATLDGLARAVWDEGNDYFPPTSFQISNVHAGTGADNVVPGLLEVRFNFRYCTEQTAAGLQAQVEAALSGCGVPTRMAWAHSGAPFLTAAGTLTRAVQESIAAVTGAAGSLSTSGGTSDGRFFAPMGCDVVEVGHVNATIHKIDECVRIADLEPLADIYLGALERLLPE